MTYKPLHCWDCGVRVIEGEQGRFVLLPTFRQVKFGLADGSYCESPFCGACAQQTWTPDRVQAFEAAVNRVTPWHQIHITSVMGVTLPGGPILAILDPAQTVQANRG